MLMSSQLLRVALTGALIAFSAAPSFAGPKDVALLQSFVGTWKGSAKLQGPEKGTVACRLTFKPRGDALSFSGRCAMAGAGNNSFSGVISYNEARKRFESASSNGIVGGKKSGGGVVFTMQDRTLRGQYDSTMAMTPGAIRVDFRAIDAKTKDVTQARIPFIKT